MLVPHSKNILVPCVATMIGLIVLSGTAAAQGGFARADQNSDGVIDRQELEAFGSGRRKQFDRWDELMKAIDQDGDGQISATEFKNRRPALRKVLGKTRKGNRPGKAQPRGGRGQNDPNALKVGDLAPPFTLKSPDGKTEFTLSDYRDKKPVVLLFGSYT